MIQFTYESHYQNDMSQMKKSSKPNHNIKKIVAKWNSVETGALMTICIIGSLYAVDKCKNVGPNCF